MNKVIAATEIAGCLILLEKLAGIPLVDKSISLNKDMFESKIIRAMTELKKINTSFLITSAIRKKIDSLFDQILTEIKGMKIIPSI